MIKVMQAGSLRPAVSRPSGLHVKTTRRTDSPPQDASLPNEVLP
jgi:hypothetical protein